MSALPGASRSSEGDEFENSDTSMSLVFTEPTAMALDTQAGAVIWLMKPLFPDATIVATPWLRSG